MITRCKDCYVPTDGSSRCDPHRLAHNARTNARRKELAAAGKCWVCGKRCAKVKGVQLRTCKAHREYFRARAAAALTSEPISVDTATGLHVAAQPTPTHRKPPR